ncbi:helix-turn-helix domain-containing protein [Streptomyces noursei]|uniref:helix-turn-helix domain-containing protein n=1 Tax=Streptomyces noursei TaxID=1971 RepID=UPI0023B85CD9|nr:helix-turn-helix transcriptional regulator [Streptomyces noursei]
MKYAPKSLTPYVSARHYFGSELRRHREEVRMSLVQLADIVNSSKSNLARVETAEMMPPPELPSALDAAFGTGQHFHGLYQLAKREVHPDQYRRFMDLEAQAEAIEMHDSQVVPGLLQTREYAYAHLRCEEGLTEEQVQERVNARLSRQEPRPDRTRAFRWAIIGEAALRRPVGSTECMYKQLASLLAQVDTPTSRVQVMPFSAGPYLLMTGTLILLTLPDGSSMAYEESFGVSHLYEGWDTVKRWRREYEMARANALSLAESAELIRKAMEEYQSCDTPPN